MDAGSDNTDGTGNTFIGKDAGQTSVSGDNNTALGNISSTLSAANCTALGFGATSNASNKVRIGNTSVAIIEGQVAYSFPSDARFKYNIHDDQVPGLSLITRLHTVNYQFDTRKFDEHLMKNMPDSTRQKRMAALEPYRVPEVVQTGFLAQEVEQACADLQYAFSGLHIPESDVDNYSLSYDAFVPILVKAMQEQQAEIKALEDQLAELRQQNEKLSSAASSVELLKADVELLKSMMLEKGQ
ncbi:MAG: tail fiber domain-containing protein [Saprospiraceae bacterium]|nr:tail fiber domain-containing protein [Candidatus Opimibacter iunctus]